MADIKTLKVFRTVAACGSFHAAADELNLSVSAISMQTVSYTHLTLPTIYSV